VKAIRPSKTTRRSAWRMTTSALRAFATGMVVLVAGAASAQGYYDKTRVVKIVVPTGAGSALDSLARAYGKGLSESSGLNTVVDNRPGAESVPGVVSVLQAPADGYTMLLVSSSMMAINPVVIPKLAYDPLKDFVPLVTTSKAGLVMSLGTSTNFKSLKEFIAAAKANPGKHTCATSSSTLRMACEYLQASAGIKLLNVPYKTTAAAFVAVAAGEVDTIFVDAGSAIPSWQTGRVRPLVVTTPERLPALPQVPTTREEGVPEFLMSAWYAIYFKAGTPPAAVTAMREMLRKAGTQQTVKDALKSFVHDPLDLAGDDITTMTRTEIAHWNKLVRDRGIKVDGN
jgi:tripartite-type tricarboxylate transporter receptor subunit TctC